MMRMAKIWINLGTSKNHVCERPKLFEFGFTNDRPRFTT